MCVDPRAWLILGLAAVAHGAAAADLSRDDLALLNRITWGVTARDAVEFERLGADKWLERQLHPPVGDRLPPDAQAEIDAMPIAERSMADLATGIEAQNQALKAITDPDQKKAAQQARQKALNDLARQAAARDILRDLYSPDQLKE